MSDQKLSGRHIDNPQKLAAPKQNLGSMAIELNVSLQSAILSKDSKVTECRLHSNQRCDLLNCTPPVRAALSGRRLDGMLCS